MELYVKAGPDGESIGDCPFAHFVRAVIHAKGLECKVIPRTKDNKPDWLVNDYDGKMPCLKNGDDIVTESSTIINYLENSFSDVQVECDQDQSVLHLTQGFFPAFAAFMKKEEYDQKLWNCLNDELGKLDRHMETSGGPFLCKMFPTLADLNLGPKLYHLKITLEHFYPNKVNQMLPPRVKAYMEEVLACSPIAECSYPAEHIIAGWSAARK